MWGCTLKLLPTLERIEREKEQEQKDVYLKQCCQALTDVIVNVVHSITKGISSDLHSLLTPADIKNPPMKKILSSPHLKSLKESIHKMIELGRV